MRSIFDRSFNNKFHSYNEGGNLVSPNFKEEIIMKKYKVIFVDYYASRNGRVYEIGTFTNFEAAKACARRNKEKYETSVHKIEIVEV